MVLFGVKGPKAILSSAIAAALAEYFVVDANLIESNLLKDAKIVLRHVQLRKQATYLVPQNSSSRPTFMTVTGSVDEVAFTWAWYVRGGKQKDTGEASSSNGTTSSWVKDAALTIKGLRFRVQLEHGTGEEELTRHPNLEAESSKLDASAEIRDQGGMKAYIRKQVQMIVDSLTLNIVDFEFTVEMPPPLTSLQDEAQRFAIVMGGNEVELLSFGRHEANDSDVPVQSSANQRNGSNGILKQRLTIGSFYTSIDAIIDDDKETFPLMEPFSYSAEATRTAGERFSGMATGVEVVGRPIATAVEAAGAGTEDGLVLHAGTVQIKALTQLGVMLLAPPNANGGEKVDIADMIQDQTKEPQVDALYDVDGAKREKDVAASTFVFPISSVSLIWQDTTRMTVPMLIMIYRADGTIMNMKAEGFHLESLALDGQDRGAAISMSGIKASMRPDMALEFSAVETLYIPDVIELTNPIHNSIITYEGKTLSIGLESIEATLLSKREQEKEVATSNASVESKQARASASKSTSIQDSSTAGTNEVDGANSSSARVALPFPMNLSVRTIQLRKEVDNSAMQLQDLSCYLNPKRETCVGTQIAIRLGKFQNELLLLNKANIYALLPLDRPNEVQAFNFAAESARVTAGHSTDEWSDKFDHRTSPKITKKSKKELLKFPFATIAALKLTVTWKGKGMSVKDTSIVIKAFRGTADTTEKDLAMYYAQACLGRVSGFISNAEVLSLNVVDTSATTYGAFLGMSLMGAGGGLAAITAVDGVKGAVAAGKRSREVDEGEGWKPGDFIRGVVYSSQEATAAGFTKRGKQEGKGNVADFVVGATSAAGEYVGENKSRLGAAGAGGVGMVVGTMFGGPIGGIVGGVLASAVTGKSIDHVEDKTKRKSVQK